MRNCIDELVERLFEECVLPCIGKRRSVVVEMTGGTARRRKKQARQ